MMRATLPVVALLIVCITLSSVSAKAGMEIWGLASNGTAAMITYYSTGGFHTVLYDGRAFYKVPIPKSREEITTTPTTLEPRDWRYYEGLNPTVVGYFRGQWVFDGVERIATFDGKTFRVYSKPGCSTCAVVEFRAGKKDASLVMEKVTMLTYQTLV
ncbi:hypothetical protein [Thermococcus sp.]|uniref:hypothetical protein n=1 Tax=Thermococcus sp. TaxID=35749 RepID=UPI0026227103|nr:hypothetical protein [Thermococcus sp.]